MVRDVAYDHEIKTAVEKFHPETRRRLSKWMQSWEHCVVGKHDGYDYGRVGVHTADRYPAFALACAYEVAHPSGIGYWLDGHPLSKVKSSARIDIGPDVPAERLRVRFGRKWPRVIDGEIDFRDEEAQVAE